jgi:hypothetical protein
VSELSQESQFSFDVFHEALVDFLLAALHVVHSPKLIVVEQRLLVPQPLVGSL